MNLFELCGNILFDNSGEYDHDLTITDNSGRTPLHALCEDRSITAKMIEKYDLSIYKDATGYTPLHSLCINKSVTIEMIKKYDLTIRDNNGYTPLHNLCINPSITANMLLDNSGKKYDLTIRDNDGWIPLHALCRNNSITNDMLLNNSSKKYDLMIEDNFNDTLLRLLCCNDKTIPEIFYEYDVSPYFDELDNEKCTITIYTLTLPYNLKINEKNNIDLQYDYENYCAGIYRRDKFHLAHPLIRQITAMLIYMRLPSYIAIHIGVLSFTY